MQPAIRAPWRLVVFGLLAPCLGIAVVLALVLLATGLTSPGHEIGLALARDFRRSYLVFLYIGLPIALVLELVIGIPAFFLLRRSGRLSRASVVSVAAVAGAIGFLLPMSVMPGMDGPGLPISIALMGATGGAITGLVFWAGVFGGVRPR